MRPGEKAPVHGNEHCVLLLERWLAEARKGNIGYAAVVTAEWPSTIGYDASGVAELEPLALEGIDHLLEKIAEWRRDRTLPPRDPALGADFHCYGGGTAPYAWDFLNWLVDAEMQRRREGAPAPLKVAFWFPQGRTEPPGREGMFRNVVRPLLALIGAVEDERALLGRHKAVYVPREICAAVNQAREAVPVLRATDRAREFVAPWFRDGRRPVVITLREATHWPHRNSNMDAWLAFARDLRAAGERVVFVRDTEKVREPIGEGFEQCHPAALDVDIRMALYEQAMCCMFVSNGPSMLTAYSHVPYLAFVALLEDDAYPCNRPGFFTRSYGLPDGGQYPWARPDQRIVWAFDTYENITAAWNALQPALARAA